MIDKYEVDGGIAFGIGGSIGFKYGISERFFIGPEFSEAILYHYVDGKDMNSLSSYDANGNLVFDYSSNMSIKKSGIMLPLLIFSINASYRF